VAEKVSRLSYGYLALNRVRDFVDRIRLRSFGPFSCRDPKKLGLVGEGLACRELERRGYFILERRRRLRHGEIDIIARDGGALVFIEVKTRRKSRFGPARDAVSWRKQKKLVHLARSYTARRKWGHLPIRFDIVGVDVDASGKPNLEVLRNAF
jgi:putative endonuclease